MVLSGEQRKQLQEALESAFPTKALLEQMLSHELDKNLEAIAGVGSLQEIIFKIIQIAEAQGWILDLIRAAQQSNPGNPKLKAIDFAATNILNVTYQITTKLIPLVENNQKLSQPEKSGMLNYLAHLINEVSSLENSPDRSQFLTDIHKYKIPNIPAFETIQAHYLLAEYLEPIQVRCYLVFLTATKTLEEIDISKFYEKKQMYKAVKTFCDYLFICLDWLYTSVKWFYAFSLPNKSKAQLKSCPQELLKYAFDTLKIEANQWTDNAEVAREVNIYLNLLLQQISN
jgi:hypothetical protein